MSFLLRLGFLGLGLGLLAGTAGAGTRRPLETEDVTTLGAGQIELQLSGDYLTSYSSQVEDLHGTLLRLPVAALSLGVADRVEFQVRLPLRQRYSPEGQEPRSATGDATLATKFRILGSSSLGPALGARLLVKLPNLSEDSGIGTDETDVTLELLAQLRIPFVDLHASAGYAILGDARRAASQNDKLTLGVGLLLPFGLADLALDLHGLTAGDRSEPDRWLALAGLARGLGPLRLDAAAGIESARGRKSLFLTAGATLTLRLLRPAAEP